MFFWRARREGDENKRLKPKPHLKVPVQAQLFPSRFLQICADFFCVHLRDQRET
ncbi:hypothetical protein NIASO_10470 [Niabella soli DSM 19437]|uniref:Uncharacterized protein n=1 Tax=Niabella soli DSM 19437 TaxID=929713 RepID=W0F803_9BACT|nr:hypothetical protein NIASO_10470 [Niabella soli DSM 19437]